MGCCWRMIGFQARRRCEDLSLGEKLGRIAGENRDIDLEERESFPRQMTGVLVCHDSCHDHITLANQQHAP